MATGYIPVSHPFSVNTGPCSFGYRTKVIFVQIRSLLGVAAEEVLLVWCVGKHEGILGLSVKERDLVLPAQRNAVMMAGPPQLPRGMKHLEDPRRVLG